jgi:hypothetical protein
VVKFPVSITYSDANKPSWLGVIKEDPSADFQLTITLESYDRMRFDEVNIEGLLVDLPKAITDTGLTVADVNAIIAFIRFTAPRLTLVINGTGVDNFEIILPPGVTVSQVVKATGEQIPFFYNVARNSVVFTVEFHSIEEIQLLVASISSVLNRAVVAISGVMITLSVLQMIIRQMSSIAEEVRRRI